MHTYLGHTCVPLREIYLPPEGLEVKSGCAAGPGQRAAPQAATSGGSCGREEEEQGLDSRAWESAISTAAGLEEGSGRGPDSAGGGSGGAAAAAHAEGCQRNFQLVHAALASLGGVPAMVSATDIAYQGADEKTVALFLAFLCQRLLEVSKEERAAMVMQRLWRRRAAATPFSMRQHLYGWVAAAAAVQRAVRAWLLRRGLARLAAARRRQVAALVRLQAAWRGRAARREFQELRHAAVGLQAAWRGRQARRLVFHSLVLPRVLEQGLRQKRELEASRLGGRLLRAAMSAQALWRAVLQRRTFLQLRQAAVLIQAAARGRQARARFCQQRAAVLAIHRHWRGHAMRRHAAVQRAAAVVVQAAWRRHTAQQRFMRLRAAAVVLQSTERARQARALLRQHRAAQRVQAAWRGRAARQALAAQQAAALAIQAAWRCHVARSAFLRQRRAAVAVAGGSCHGQGGGPGAAAADRPGGGQRGAAGGGRGLIDRSIDVWAYMASALEPQSFI